MWHLLMRIAIAIILDNLTFQLDNLNEVFQRQNMHTCSFTLVFRMQKPIASCTRLYKLAVVSVPCCESIFVYKYIRLSKAKNVINTPLSHYFFKVVLYVIGLVFWNRSKRESSGIQRLLFSYGFDICFSANEGPMYFADHSAAETLLPP